MRRVFFAVLMILMLLFMAVQVNDPDGVLWIAIYGVPAIWCAIAAFWPQGFSYVQTLALLVASIVASFVGVVWFWPLSPQFWTKDVWYNVETAREGMGLMIVAGILLAVFFACAKKAGLGSVNKTATSA